MPQEDVRKPDYLVEMEVLRKTLSAHTFLLTGNVYDYVPDSSLTLLKAINYVYDLNVRKDLGLTPDTPQIVITVSPTEGLMFAHPLSRDLFTKTVNQFYQHSDFGDTSIPRPSLEAKTLPEIISMLNSWMLISSEMSKWNRIGSRFAEKIPRHVVVHSKIVFTDADLLFPNSCSIEDAYKIFGCLRGWSHDRALGDYNTIILLASDRDKINPQVIEDCQIVNLKVPLPSRQDRLNWLLRLDSRIKEQQEKNPLIIKNRVISGIELAEGFSLELLAEQTEGQSLSTINSRVIDSWTTGIPIGV
jgi:hypothetical protein